MHLSKQVRPKYQAGIGTDTGPIHVSWHVFLAPLSCQHTNYLLLCSIIWWWYLVYCGIVVLVPFEHICLDLIIIIVVFFFFFLLCLTFHHRNVLWCCMPQQQRASSSAIDTRAICLCQSCCMPPPPPSTIVNDVVGLVDCCWCCQAVICSATSRCSSIVRNLRIRALLFILFFCVFFAIVVLQLAMLFSSSKSCKFP